MGFSETRRVLSLETIFVEQKSMKDTKTAGVFFVPRRVRLSIATSLARSLLQLHPGPWLNDALSKKSVYFFQDQSGEIRADMPFYLWGLP